MTIAYIGLGANLGNREKAIAGAVRRLGESEGLRVIKVAAVIETDPAGPAAQGKFLNTVCAVETELAAGDLLKHCLRIEEDLGRERNNEEQRWGPRLIDLDILLFGEAIIDEPGLTVPHPEMHKRRFVLEPLGEIAPAAVHPGLKVTAAELLVGLRQVTG